MKTIRTVAAAFLLLGLCGPVVAQYGSVKFRAIVTVGERHDATGDCYGSYVVEVAIDEVLRDDEQLLTDVRFVEVRYAESSGLQVGDRVEVCGRYRNGTGDRPQPYDGCVIAFEDAPYIKVLPTPDLYVGTRTGVWKVSLTGARQMSVDALRYGDSVEISGNMLYGKGQGIMAYDLEGHYLKTIPIPPGVGYLSFVALPDERFALLNNEQDKVFFINSRGSLLATADLRDTADINYQSMNGVVVGGRLIVAHDGDGRILQIDLATYEVSILKDLRALPPEIHAVAYADGKYYVCASRHIYSFAESSSPVKIATLPGWDNISGIVVIDGFAYVTVRATGEIYKVDLGTGTAAILASGLDSPQDLEYAGRTSSSECIDTVPAPAYDSGWLEMTVPGENKLLAHGLGGSPDDYKVDMMLRCSNIAGTPYLTNQGIGQDFYYADLTTQTVTVVGPQSMGADHRAWVRVRIWLCRQSQQSICSSAACVVE